MLGAIETLRIESLPPLVPALGHGQIAVVRNARERTGFVRAVRGLKPPPVARLMHGDAEAKSLLTRRGSPGANHVAMRADADGVPRLVLRVPGVEAVVMVGQRHEEAGAGLLVARRSTRPAPS